MLARVQVESARRFGGALLVMTEASRVLHDYRPGQHVAAALELFASIALLFWYVLRLFSSDD